MRFAHALLAVVLIVFAASTPRLVRAQTPDDAAIFAAANQLYEDAEYSRAASSYERLAALGYDDSDLYYNLGNSYYKQGEFGRAVLSYLRAKRLAPNDPDLEANLGLARKHVKDLIERPAASGPLVALADTLSLLSRGDLAAAALALWAAASISAIWAFMSRGRRGRRIALRTLLAAAALLMVSVLAVAGRIQQYASLDDAAVVVAESVEVLSGPGDQYVSQFTLHGGAEADLVEAIGQWSRVSIPSTDLQGWVPSAAVELVFPPTS